MQPWGLARLAGQACLAAGTQLGSCVALCTVRCNRTPMGVLSCARTPHHDMWLFGRGDPTLRFCTSPDVCDLLSACYFCCKLLFRDKPLLNLRKSDA